VKKRILYLDNSFTFGGAIISLRTLLRGIDRKNYQPILLTSHTNEYLQDKFEDIIYYKLDIKLPWVHNRIFIKVTSSPLFRNKMILKIAVIIRAVYWFFFITVPEALHYYKIGKKNNVNIVHLNNIFGSQPAGILAAKLLRVPCIAHLRDFEKISFITKFYAGMIDFHIAISSAIKNNLLQLGVPQEKIAIVHDAIDLDEFNEKVAVDHLFEEFNIEKGQKLFGIFGRIIKWKGIKEFILASDQVFKDVPNAKAFIVGGISDGTENYYRELRSIIKELDLDGKIILTGYRDDIPSLMKFMDIIVHASIRPEPFGIVVIEGMAMGKPVVATASGGPLDIVLDGETGILVPQNNVDEMARAIIKLLESPTLSKNLGTLARQRIELLFTKERYARQVEQIYEYLLTNRSIYSYNTSRLANH
jgi:glycosyltransferase involved in cell wall biosynthesis